MRLKYSRNCEHTGRREFVNRKFLLRHTIGRVSAGIKQQRFRRFCRQYMQPVDDQNCLLRARDSGSAIFLLTQIQTWPHDIKRSAKRRRLLESDAKEYPAGLIADDGRGRGLACAPKETHRTDRSRCLHSKPVSKPFWKYARLRTFS